MRSRTELVTTTFVDSEEDQTETEDSEEDWRPDSNRNGRKRPVGRPPAGGGGRGRRRKRKPQSSSSSSSTAAAGRGKSKKQKYEYGKGGEDMEDEEEEDSEEASGTISRGGIIETGDHRQYEKCFQLEPTALEQKLLAGHNEKHIPDKSGIFNLYLYKKDLDKDYKSNSHLCLWRRDGSSLLQKYIRVKTNNIEEFIFTSSSVYSSWDENRRKDFAVITVKCAEENNRRVSIMNINELKALADETIKRKDDKIVASSMPSFTTTTTTTTTIKSSTATGKSNIEEKNYHSQDDEDDNDGIDGDEADDEINSENDDQNSATRTDTDEDYEDDEDNEDGSDDDNRPLHQKK